MKTLLMVLTVLSFQIASADDVKPNLTSLDCNYADKFEAFPVITVGTAWNKDGSAVDEVALSVYFPVKDSSTVNATVTEAFVEEEMVTVTAKMDNNKTLVAVISVDPELSEGDAEASYLYGKATVTIDGVKHFDKNLYCSAVLSFPQAEQDLN